MSYTVTQQNILSVEADAAVIRVENPVSIADGPVNEALAAPGGEELRLAIRKERFLPVGFSFAVEACPSGNRSGCGRSANRWRSEGRRMS